MSNSWKHPHESVQAASVPFTEQRNLPPSMLTIFMVQIFAYWGVGRDGKYLIWGVYVYIYIYGDY